VGGRGFKTFASEEDCGVDEKDVKFMKMFIGG
jgi:hypothetical protein